MLRLLTIGLAHSKLHLDSDVLKDWQKYQTKYFSPEAIPKVLMMRLQSRTEGIDCIIADGFILLHDQAREVSQDWEP